MNLVISPVAVCRTPVFSFNDELENAWPDLKMFIKESSPAFYAEIAGIGYHEIIHLQPRLQFTIWKYFNRAKFRATPYGKFASFSVIPVKKADVSVVTLENRGTYHSFTDWPETANIDLAPGLLLKNADFFISNATFYDCGSEIRYLFFENEQFELATVKSNRVIKELLKFCSKKRKLHELNRFTAEKLKISEEDTHSTLIEMLDAQLLLTNLSLNITGRDYFERTGHTATIKKYLITERKLSGGHISYSQLANIKGSIDAVADIIPNRKVKVLEDFKKAFINRFEHKIMPLQMVLDPETGIGYARFEQKQEEENVIHELLALSDKPPAVTALMQDKWLIQKIAAGENIRLEDRHVWGKATGSTNLPNNFSCLLSVINHEIVMEMCGGVTATSLMGRFTMASEALEKLAVSIAADEQDCNPGVLFFDIAYHGDRQVDNVNRRKNIYPYELPILTWTDHEQVLNVNDLYITVRNDEVMLFSRTYNKRVVPRLGSSYNYTRSALTLFRFLSDLQKQHLQTNLTLNIQEILPGLDYYPRVSYKNITLNLKKWLVPARFCATHFSKSADALSSLQTWMQEMGIKFFRCGQNDQKLYFGPENEQDLRAFLMYAQGKTDLYIEEYGVPSGSFFQNESGMPFAAEIILSIQHKQPVYQPLQITKIEWPAKKKPMILPGEEWLYFEVFCHNTQSNHLLTHQIKKFITLYQSKISKWFFIRYDKPTPHLRVRIKLNNKHDFQLLVTGFTSKLKTGINNGLIHDIAIKTYYPETERYDEANLDNVEQCFYLSSGYILQLLSYEQYQPLLYSITMNFMDQVLMECKFDLQQQLAFYQLIANLFTDEMKLKGDAFRKINQSFKELKFPPPPEKPAEKRLAVEQNRLSKQLAVTIAAHPPALRTKLLADLFHMHINRLFYSNQRMNELLIYHYLVIRVKKQLQTRLDLDRKKTIKKEMT